MFICFVLEICCVILYIEGVGVYFYCVFGFQDLFEFDLFLLFDDFCGDYFNDYMCGFLWYFYCGIEIIIYVLNGIVEYGDSFGNYGILGVGDVQWMIVGLGIFYQEMFKGNIVGQMYGF